MVPSLWQTVPGDVGKAQEMAVLGVWSPLRLIWPLIPHCKNIAQPEVCLFSPFSVPWAGQAFSVLTPRNKEVKPWGVGG